MEPADDGTDLLDPRGACAWSRVGPDDPPFTIADGPRVGVAYAGPGWADRPVAVLRVARIAGAGDGDAG